MSWQDNYDNWRCRTPEDEEDAIQRRLNRELRDADRADEMRDREKDERAEREHDRDDE